MMSANCFEENKMEKEKKEALPIEAFKSEILGSNSQYLIIEAETGSGKSTMVPQWYHELGFRVLVTEPLIETVRGTSEYVAELMGVRFGTTVGFRTGDTRQDSPETEILFCTDGLALVREMSSGNRYDILIVDELHEWNTNQSTLEAWAWKHLQAGDSFFKKIVVLSATLDSAELSRKRGNAPVFKVPGRQFPIVDRVASRDLSVDVKALVVEGFDVLVFQPGEAEIKKTISDLTDCGAELIPFYGKLERAEKDKAYKSYSRPKVIVSTNSLETGRTILPSSGRKLAVVDSGMERRIELIDGIESLVLAPIAKARGKQRRGRTGRVGEGVYIDHCPASTRPEYPVPEILRTRLDQTVLRLAIAGYDATDLPFFHQLDTAVIADAKRSLHALGAMDENGAVTRTGKFMARLPVSVQYARMIVEAERLGVMDDVLTIVAILEQGSVRARDGKWTALTQEKGSDLLAELDVWMAAERMSGQQMRESGVFAPAIFKAKDLRRKLASVLPSSMRHANNTHATRMDILKACVAGMVDHLYRNEHGSYRNGGSGTRELAKESVVKGGAEWVTAKPFTISGKNNRGRPFVLNLITQVSKVDPAWLVEIAPQLVKIETGLSPAYDPNQDACTSVSQTHFNAQKVKEDRLLTPEHTEASQKFAEWIACQMV